MEGQFLQIYSIPDLENKEQFFCSIRLLISQTVYISYLQDNILIMKHQKLEGAKIKTFNILKKLGEGAWAVVYEAVDERDSSQVALKAIPKQLMVQTPKLQELVQTQINVLKQCKNQNVIRFIDNFSSQKSVCIVMEYCDGGDLQKYLQRKHRLAEDQATTFLKQIINGFKGLHEVNAMHRDFKVSNVLLHKGICKIAGLGFAKHMTTNVTKTIIGTSLTMAPEVLDERPYGFEADIWSLGVVYYLLLYGKYPYMGMSDMDILKKIRNSRPDFNGVNLSPNARSFIDKCLNFDPKQRISWKEIYNQFLPQNQSKPNYKLSEKFKGNFYEREIKIDESLMFEYKKYFQQQKIKQMEQDYEQKALELQKLKKKIQNKKVDLATQQYGINYLNHKHNIMFIFKYVAPYIYFFSEIKAAHEITFFILSKKAYHDMKRFNSCLKNKSNFLQLSPYFKQFTCSSKYKEIQQIIQKDIDLIMSQTMSYRKDISTCSQQVKKEFDIQKVFHKNPQKLLSEFVGVYVAKLNQGLDKVKGQNQRDLIKVIEALSHYKYIIVPSIEQINRKMEKIENIKQR